LNPKHPQDVKSGKFVKKGLVYHNSFENFINEEAKIRESTPEDVAREIFSNEYSLIEFNEATGKASLVMYSESKDVSIDNMKPEALMNLYRDLRENFPPVSAGIEYHKTYLCGNGFDVVSDDIKDKHKIEMRDECRKLSKNIYMDYYRVGLDKLIFILADDILTFGMAAAEIIYDRDIAFEEFAKEEIVTKDGKSKKVWTTRMPTQREWKSFKKIKRLKIIKDANLRLIPYMNPKSLETKYWTLDEKSKKSVEEHIAEVAGIVKPETGTKLHPFEVLWLSWNTRNIELKGESIIRPVIEMARLVRKIQRAIGTGFERWADKKYFFVCGSEKRPWNRNSQRRFVKYLELMIILLKYYMLLVTQ